MREASPREPSREATERRREVATVLVAIGRDRAARLLQHFDPAEVDALRAMGTGGSKLPNVSAGELGLIAERFEAGFRDGPGVVGAERSFASLLAEVDLPSPALALEDPAPADAAARERRWAAVAQASEGDLATWLAEENEAVGALVLSRMPAPLSARLLKRLPPEPCGAIVAALPHVDASPDAEDLVLDLIEAELIEGGSGDEERTPSLLAAIVNELDPAMGETVTRQLERSLTPQQLSAMQARIFRFEDVVRMAPSDRAVLLGETSADSLVQALAGAEEELREAVLSSLGQRMRRMVESELEGGGAVGADAVRDARRAIAERAVSMAADGLCALPKAA